MRYPYFVCVQAVYTKKKQGPEAVKFNKKKWFV